MKNTFRILSLALLLSGSFVVAMDEEKGGGKPAPNVVRIDAFDVTMEPKTNAQVALMVTRKYVLPTVTGLGCLYAASQRTGEVRGGVGVAGLGLLGVSAKNMWDAFRGNATTQEAMQAKIVDLGSGLSDSLAYKVENEALRGVLGSIIVDSAVGKQAEFQEGQFDRIVSDAQDADSRSEAYFRFLFARAIKESADREKQGDIARGKGVIASVTNLLEDAEE